MPNGRWNPNDPGVIGLEHAGTGYAISMIDAQSKQIALRWRAAATGVIDEAHIHAGTGSASPVVDSYRGIYRPMLVEIMPRASEIAATGLTLTTFAVNEVVATSGFTDEAGGAPAASDFTTNSDGFYVKSSAFANSIDLRFATAGAGAGSLLGRHILQVVFYLIPTNILDGGKFRMNVHDSTGNNWMTSALGAAGQPVLFVGEGRCVTPPPGGPAAWSHWAPSDIDLFDTTWFLRVFNVNPSVGTIGIEQLYMQVVSIPERRLAVGLFEPRFPNTWHTVPLVKPDKTGTWSRTAGQDYTTVIRRMYPFYNHKDNMPVQDATLGHRHVNGPVADGLLSKHEISAVDGGTLQASAIGPNLLVTPLIRYRFAGVDVAESQPYAMQWGVGVYSFFFASQEVRTTVTDDYGVMFVMLSTDLNPTDALTFNLVNMTTLATIATATVTVEQVNDAPIIGSANVGDINNPNGVPRNWRYVTVEWSTIVNLVAGTTYRVDMISVGTDAAHAWLVGILLAEGLYEAQTYGNGTLDASGYAYMPSLETVGGGTVEGDMQLLIAAAPDPPANFVTGVGTQYLGPADDACVASGCRIGDIKHVAVGWSATALAGAFSRYEIQRQDAYGGPSLIAEIHTEATVIFHDYESRLGVQSQYRMRVVRSDGVPSLWTAWSDETPTSTGPELHFTTNEQPELNVAYHDIYDGAPARDFEFPEVSETALRTLYGRNHQVAFRPLERRGSTFTRRLLVSAKTDTVHPTLDVLSPLRDIAWATLSYVCVRDGEGNRWFANITVPSGTIRRPGKRYFADVGVVEVTDIPSAPDVV